MTRDEDARFMALALGLGARGQGRTWPNPSVGCVIVRDGLVLGRGWTQPRGRPHAERVALAQAGDASAATAYVTLEPCAHHGKTSPCADALVEAGITRVVYGVGDPDPRVAGKGAQILRDAGIEVASDVLADQCRRAHQGFFSRLERGRPTLTLKLATSFDGRIATATGESQWITGPEARRAVHGMRARHDAVLVGAGTARADDPMLTVRGMGMGHQPVRIVASRRLDIPLNGKLAQSARDVPLWLCHGEDADGDLIAAWKGMGAELIALPLSGRQLDVTKMMQALGSKGLNSVFSEGGGALAASLLDADLVDDLTVYAAGVALGAEGQPAIGALGLDRLADASRFALESVRALGPDVEQRWRRLAP